MTKQSRLARRLAVGGTAVLAALVISVVVLGLGQLAQMTSGAVMRVAHLSIDWDEVKDLYSFVEPRSGSRHIAADKVAAIGGMFTAVFTVMLVLVTRSMGRASRRQAAGDSPLLHVDVSVDPRPSDWPKGAVTTARMARYAHLTVQNVQSKPFAVARDIVVTIHVGETASPRRDTRRFEIELLPPGKERSVPVFDLGRFEAGQVSVVNVEYRDLRGRRRRKGAYGHFTAMLDSTGTVHLVDGYSEPKGWEMP